MINSYFHRVRAMTATQLWINNVTPAEARLALAAGATGCTQNPSYPHKMLTHPQGAEHTKALLAEILAGDEADEAQTALQRRLIMEVAEEFLPLYRESGGRLGYVTVQGDPFRESTREIQRFARYNCTAPNIMAKIPAVPAGLAAVPALLAEGIPVLLTEVMSVRQAMDAADCYEAAVDSGNPSPRLAFAHIPGIFDEYLAGAAQRADAKIPGDCLWQAGVAVAKKISALLRGRGCRIAMVSGGARGLHHFTELVGADCAVTVNWGGTADRLLESDPPVVDRFCAPTPPAVIDILLALPDFRMAWEPAAIRPEDYETFGPVALFRSSFETAWKKAEELIAGQREAMG